MGIYVGGLRILLASAIGMEVFSATLETPRFFVNWEAGQIEEAHPIDPNDIRVDKEILHHAAVWTLQEARLSDKSKLFVGVGGAYYFVFPRAPIATDPNVNSKRSAFGLTDAHGEFELIGGSEEGDHLLQLKAGIFGYKYNPDAKNLGEYMFRTWVYPSIVYTGGLEVVNSAMTQLSGIELNTKVGIFSNSFLVTLQTDHAPIFGLNAADLFSVKLGILTLGGGFMFENFYHPDSRVLESHADANKWVKVAGGDSLAAGTELAFKEFTDRRSSFRQGPDTLVVDSGYYSFAGQKVMVQASLDLGFLIPEDLRSERDMRLYFETILLGVKNYPTYYNKISERMVTLVGFNFPTFRILDLLSFEMEYAPTPWKMSTDRAHGEALAVPISDNSKLSPGTFPNVTKFTRDDFKWTFLMQKQLYSGMSLYFQAANDHMRLLDNFSSQSSYEIFQTPQHWYWAFSLKFTI
jgi:hypothetical protein